MFNLVKVGDPVFEAVTIDEVKAHCNIYHSADDDRLDRLRVSTRQLVESDLNLALVGQQYTLHLDSWCDFRPNHFQHRYIEIPIQPLLSVESIIYTDPDGEEQTLDPSMYEVKTYKDPPHIRLVDSFPNIKAYSDILVNFTAGFADAASIPQVMKHAILFVAGHWNEHREAEAETIMREVEIGYERIIGRNRVTRFH